MPSIRSFLCQALLASTLTCAATGASAQSPGNASVIVVSVDGGDIMGANSIDEQINANLAGRLGLALLAHEWLALPHTPSADTLLEGGDEGLTIGAALDRILEDGRNGEMARALISARMGYTPLLLESATDAIFDQAGVDTKGVNIARGPWGGPEWTGAISARDTAKLGVALARMPSMGSGPMLAGSGLQCIAIQPGEKTSTRWVGVVSGAVSPEGCLAAAQSSIGLTDTRVAEAERLDLIKTADTQAAEEAATSGLGLPTQP